MMGGTTQYRPFFVLYHPASFFLFTERETDPICHKKFPGIFLKYNRYSVIVLHLTP